MKRFLLWEREETRRLKEVSSSMPPGCSGPECNDQNMVCQGRRSPAGCQGRGGKGGKTGERWEGVGTTKSPAPGGKRDRRIAR